MAAQFIISLDFELLWGVRDHFDRDRYGHYVLGAREAIPRMLDLFHRYDIQATWATVGFLFCEDKDELIASIPDVLPQYDSPSLSNYSYFDEVGANEKADPYYFAPSLISAIAETPGQEIATHTLSHFYCLEDGASLESFAADISMARTLAKRRGIALKSIVFPRNQYTQPHLDVCHAQGITHYRGNPKAWAYRPGKGTEQTALRRALRLVDAYSGVLGAQDFQVTESQPVNVPASRFLRPNSGRLSTLHPRHVATIKAGMTRAARAGTGYHLWWHPHNFGANTSENLAALEAVLMYFKSLKNSHGMTSNTMVEARCA